MTEQLTIETLLTVAGITLVTGLLVQAVKVVWPGAALTPQWLRRISLIVAIVLTLLVSASIRPVEGTNLILFYIVALVNGVVAGLAASAAFDTAKYGTARVVEKPASE